MRAEHSEDTQPELDTNAIDGSGQMAGRRRVSLALGLQFVSPQLRPVPIVPQGSVPVVLGREGEGPACLEGDAISRHHAELLADGDGLIIRDLASRNGLFINGVRSEGNRLALHDVVRMGEWVAVAVALGDELPNGGAEVPLESGSDEDLHLGPTLRQVAARAARLAEADVSVVLEGETGTGKEHFARLLHAWSARRGRFVAINCAALPESLAEAEFFGYREGAFTGASRSSPGHFRVAHGGSLFLDEVTDMPLPVQAKMLRVLEQREVLPVGESQPVPVDVRIIAASQISLSRAVAEGRFRADLRARLETFTLSLPPLRQRRADVPSLFLHLLARHGLGTARLSPRLVEALCLYDWPLNVRELGHVARGFSLLHGQERLFRRSHLPEHVRCVPSDRPKSSHVLPGSPNRLRLLSALSAAGGNLAVAAKSLGISRQKAYRILGDTTPERRKNARRAHAVD